MVVATEKKKHPASEPSEVDPRLKESKSEEQTGEDHVKEISDELEKERAISADYLRRLQYLQADFENYRKRVEKEMSDNRQYGNQRLLSDLLVVNDELELAFKKAQESNKDPTIAEGVGMVLKRLQGFLSREGVEKVPGLGSKFNPDLHEAVLREESDKEEGTILEEIRQGYMLKGKILRPSIVKVAASSVERESKSEKQDLEESTDHE